MARTSLDVTMSDFTTTGSSYLAGAATTFDIIIYLSTSISAASVGKMISSVSISTKSRILTIKLTINKHIVIEKRVSLDRHISPTWKVYVGLNQANFPPAPLLLHGC